MNTFKIFALIIAVIFFLTACDNSPPDDTSQTAPVQNDTPENTGDDEYYARENLDLRAVGEILRQSDSAQDFERRLNEKQGVNNLDLNGDGYVDYISVAEFEDPDTGYRGFSLLDNFGGNAIQELATIILDRTFNGGRGSRVYIDGNDQIYGEDYFYEATWQDTTLDIIRWASGDRNEDYRSPYYYEKYPGYYEVYPVVETPIYLTRVREIYDSPVFVQTNPAMTKIKYNSPYKNKSHDEIYAKLANPTDAQKEFRKNTRNKPDFESRGRDKEKNVPPGLTKKPSDGDNIKPGKPERPEKEIKAGKDESPGRPKKVSEKPGKPEKADKKPGKGKSQNNGGGKGKGKGRGKP